MLPLIAGALIGGGASVLSGLGSLFGASSSNSTNLQIARETNENQMNMLREQNAFNHQEALDAWNRQTQYMSPANQMKLMQQAGINPNGVNFAAQTPTATQAQAASTPQLQAAYQDPGVMSNAFAAPLANMQSFRKLEEEIRKTQEETRVTRFTADMLPIKTDAELETLKQKAQRDQSASDLDQAQVQRVLTEVAANKINLQSLEKLNLENIRLLQARVQDADNRNAAYEVAKEWSKEFKIPMTPEMTNLLFNLIAMTASEQESFNTQMQQTIGKSFTGMFKSDFGSSNEKSSLSEFGQNEGTALGFTSKVKASALGLASAELSGSANYNYSEFGKNQSGRLNKYFNQYGGQHTSFDNTETRSSYNSSRTRYYFHRERLSRFFGSGKTYYNHRFDFNH